MFLKNYDLYCWVLCYLLLPNLVLSLFDQCNHNVVMKPGEKLYVNSPYYPGEYPIGSSCRYVIKAPEDHELKFNCNIKMNTPPTATKCLNEIFYFNREGSELLTGSEYFCGTGKMEKKSFLNQAVISYISTPYYKRIITNAVKEEGETAELGMKESVNETSTMITTSTTVKATTTTSTSKPLIDSHLTRKPTRVVPPVVTSTLFTTSVTTPSPSTSSISSFVSLNEEQQEDDKNVSNSFAYVVGLLSNKIDIKAFSKTTTKPKTPTYSYGTLASSSTTTSSSSSPLSSSSFLSITSTARPTSVLNFYDFLPSSTWRNGSIAIHKISSKRVSKVIVGQDYISSPQQQQPFASTHSSTYNTQTRQTEGGGSFSCLVEVIEPQCECGWSSTVKIAGASGVAGINEFPSMAGVMTIKNQKIFCGATIIHHRYLLSAAHCYITPETNRAEYLKVVVGEHDLSTVLESIYTRHYEIIDIISHEHFHTTSSKVYNDIALLRTRYPIEWNRSVGPVCLPFYTLTALDGGSTPPFTGQRVETAGWGTTSFGGKQASVLLKTTLDVISRAECQNIIRTLPSGAFCTYTPGRDTCQYDSGGALYARGERLYAVGIVSYGFACATNQPSVNTRVASHLKWIRSKTPEAKYCSK